MPKFLVTLTSGNQTFYVSACRCIKGKSKATRFDEAQAEALVKVLSGTQGLSNVRYVPLKEVREARLSNFV